MMNLEPCIRGSSITPGITRRPYATCMRTEAEQKTAADEIGGRKMTEVRTVGTKELGRKLG